MNTLLTRSECNDFYQDSAQYYDYLAPYVARDDIAFYVDEAVRSGGPVLEIGSGTGRVLLPTARAGVRITGLDASTSMQDICRASVRKEPVDVQKRIELVQGYMRSFRLADRFALVTCPFRPFQHLNTVEDQLTCLASVGEHLIDGGRFILDVFNPSVARLNDPTGVIFATEPEVALPDGRKVVRSHRITARDLLEQVMTIDMIHDVRWPDGRASQDIQTVTMRYFFRFEMEHLLCRAGFTIEALYSGTDRAPYGARYPGELIFVARKS